MVFPLLFVMIMIIPLPKKIDNMLSNAFSLFIEPNYFIPKESSIFKFEETQKNEGSGDWWLYGEDDNYYYGLNIESETPQYFKFKKGNECVKFNKTNYKTWIMD